MNQFENKLIPQHLMKYCATIDLENNGNRMTVLESGFRMNCSKSDIVKYRICISTLSSLGSLMNIKFKKDHFTHVIIDEAGQTVETESLIPISLLSKVNGQVVLAGDPKQLGPTVLNQVAKNCGFNKSFLERLSENEFYMPVYGPEKKAFDPRFVTQLKKNYRSLPTILKIYNELFYDEQLQGEIIDDNSPESDLLEKVKSILWNRDTANPKCGIYFVDVKRGLNERMRDSPSWWNPVEGSHVYMFLVKLNKIGVSMEDVGIVSRSYF